MNNKRISTIITAISSLLALLVGKINWSSPPWAKHLKQTSINKPKTFWCSFLLGIIVIIAAVFSWQWYQHLPKPQFITADITIPQITPVDDTLVPDNLIINFGIKKDEFLLQSVAPLKLISKEITTGIELTPALKGKWYWESDSQLMFVPDEDWPAGQTYHIRFSKDFFIANANMESLTYSFTTKPFEAKISEFIFYQDPVNANIHQAIATVEFNFPVDSASFEQNASLALPTIDNGTVHLEEKSFTFTVTYDKYKRKAWLRSETISISDVARFLVLTLTKSLSSASHTSKLNDTLTANVLIPDNDSYFKINQASASIVRNEQDSPNQVLMIETSIGVTEQALNKALHVYLLPQKHPNRSSEHYDWNNPGDVPWSVLNQSNLLTLHPIPSDSNYATLHSYQFNAATPGYLYLKIDKGIQGFGDFVLAHGYEAVIKVPEFPREINFLHKGALLALSSEKKLSVLIRGLPAVKFDIARVLPDNINQLVTQTQGDFNNPSFMNQSFNQQNISEIFSEIQYFDDSNPGTQQYTALDLAKYLAAPTNTQGLRGLFLLQATGWDTANNKPMDIKTSRLILMTDLGMLVKDNNDGSHDVFVQSITSGSPVANIDITVLGKNGLPIVTRTTNTDGQAKFPSLSDFVDDQEPVVYLAQSGNDVSFIPYNNSSRQLNFSRFDVGGIYNNQDSGHLSAYIFSDRGIYRPGDSIHIGMIVKQAYAQKQPAGLPLQATITDSRGTTVYDTKFTLDDTGYSSIDFDTNATSPTGQYYISLYTVKDNHAQNLLGSATIKIAEFLPDRMRIGSTFTTHSKDGWVLPEGLGAQVSLWNLYGAPAVDRRISGKILLAPKPVSFSQYPGFVFVDPLLNPDKPLKVFTENLPDAKTNEQGSAEFALNLDKFDKATYQLTFFAEGFEAEGGRSVTSQSTVLVSPLEYFIGYKSDSDLAWIKLNSERHINLIAIDSTLKQITVDKLRMRLSSLRPVTTLVKKSNGTYQYQSMMQSTILSTEPFKLGSQGTQYALPTDKPGDYALSIIDKDNSELSRIVFHVAGASSHPLARDAELSIKLSQDEYHAGDDIELQITAPYTGSGLITIERDKVYATQWFKADTKSSLQTIHIPYDFQGNGYVNVAFIRDWESPDIFISPLSYAVLPFKVNHDNHAVHITLDTPVLAKPGDMFPIHYHSDRPGKIIIFVVDEGILQVSHYETPDPLAFFFQKYALEVSTQQTVDQILPNYIKDREMSSVGGDDGEQALANHLNPFKRKTDLPVVYWSGIIDTDTNPRQVTYTIPDYFNGNLRIMAIAVSDDAVGAIARNAEVRGNFIINPNVPTFVAPGDEFDITASIANNLKGSGVNAEVNIELTTSPGLNIISHAKEVRTISEGREQTVRFRVRATDNLGNASIRFTASIDDKATSTNATLSVRPATLFMTTVTSNMTKDSSITLSVLGDIYSQYRHAQAVASNSPLILVNGLQRYLDNFPYGCTEQLVSKAMPLFAVTNQPGFTQRDKATDKIAATIQMLSQRQMSNGGFSYWPDAGDNSNNTFASVYAMQFLTEAKALGYYVPDALLYAGISYLKELAAQTPIDFNGARLQAYAIYLLTRNELVTTNYLTGLLWYFEQNKTHTWQNDIAGSYIAATYKLLKNDREAQRLISQYTIQEQQEGDNDFYDTTIANAQYLYLVARHFPERLHQVGETLVMSLVNAMNSNEINTLSSSFTSLALGIYTNNTSIDTNASFSMTEFFDNAQQKKSANLNHNVIRLILSNSVKRILINNPAKKPLFYQLTQSGFSKKIPDTELKQGMEIYREYRELDGSEINHVTLGNDIEVHIKIRALDNRYLSNIAIVDLLPGGFEIVPESLKIDGIDYTDSREDRIIFFTWLTTDTKELTYRIKATNTGDFTVPPVFAESMYDPAIKAHNSASTITVVR